MEEENTLRALCRGREEALGQVMDHYSPYVYTIVSGFLSGTMGPADVEEVMADTFYTLWKNAKKVRPGKLKAYLGAVARNLSRERLRTRGLDLPLEEDVLSLPGESLEDLAAEKELAELVRRAVLAMGEPDREIFLRHYYCGQKLGEIAQRMGMNLSTVKTRLRRGRESLRAQLMKGGTEA